MGEESSNTNLASEYYVLSCLYRLGADAYITLGDKKSVDIIVKSKQRTITIDVKGLKGTSNFPIDNFDETIENHYFVFVAYNNKIIDLNYLPDIYIVPSKDVNKEFPELSGKTLAYQNPKGNKKVVQLIRIKKLAKRYKDKWELLFEPE